MQKETNVRVHKKDSLNLGKIARQEGRNKKKMFEIVLESYITSHSGTFANATVEPITNDKK